MSASWGGKEIESPDNRDGVVRVFGRDRTEFWTPGLGRRLYRDFPPVEDIVKKIRDIGYKIEELSRVAGGRLGVETIYQGLAYDIGRKEVRPGVFMIDFGNSGERLFMDRVALQINSLLEEYCNPERRNRWILEERMAFFYHYLLTLKEGT